MTLHLRALDVQVRTADGQFGRQVRFDRGLNVIRANNTSGKSTLLNTIPYALGLEGAFAPTHAPALTQALTNHLDSPRGTHRVEESGVFLEVENGAREVYTIFRPIKTSGDRRLVKVYAGPAITERQQGLPQRDYFVRYEGAAQREDGFHHWLSHCLEWSPPEVVRYDGSSAQLPMEYLFPFFYVEQKRGWAGLLNNLPNYMQVKDAGARSFEFLTGMETPRVTAERQRLEQERARLRERWFQLRGEAAHVAKAVPGIADGIPSELPREPWDGGTAVLQMQEGTTWLTLQSAIRARRQRLAAVRLLEQPTAAAVSTELSSQLDRARQDLAALEIAERESHAELLTGRSELTAVDQRIDAVQVDLQRYQDIQRLRQLGSETAAALQSSECPTCHQVLPNSLLPFQQPVMSLDENVTFLEAQLRSFRNLRAQLERSILARERQLDAMRQRADRLRIEIRGLKDTALQASGSPAVSVVRQEVTLEEDVRRLTRVEEEFFGIVSLLAEAAAEHLALIETIRGLPSGRHTEGDVRKLRRFRDLIIEQLGEYEFSSFDRRQVTLSSETYRPEHEGFALTLEASASDLVRLIWSYHWGLVELDREFDTNHPGLLILDEPRQQEASQESYRAFLTRLGRCGEFNQQAIIMTSQPVGVLNRLLEGVPHRFHTIEGKTIAPR